MIFNKTTVLPQQPPEEAQRLLREAIYDKQEVIFVVLGASDARAALVSRAGRLARDEMGLRWVVWARDLQSVLPVIASLKEGPEQSGARAKILGGGVQAFTVSFRDRICDIIENDEEVDNSRVEFAYAAAEEDEGK